MTKSKRMFAEMLVQEQGFGDPDEIAKNNSLVDIIYAIKKAELTKEKPEPESVPEPKLEQPKPESFKIRDIWSWLSEE